MYGTNYYGRKPYAIGEVFYPTISEIYTEDLSLVEYKSRTVLRNKDEIISLNESSPKKDISWFISEVVLLRESFIKYAEKTISEGISLAESLLRRVLRGFQEAIGYEDLGLNRTTKRVFSEEVILNETTKREIDKKINEGILLTETVKATIPGGKYLWNKIGAVVSNLWEKQPREQDSSFEKIGRTENSVWVKTDRPTEINLPSKIGRVLSSDWTKILREISGVTTKIARTLNNIWQGIVKPSSSGYTKIEKEVTSVWSKKSREEETSTTKQSRSLTNLWTKKDRPNE